MCYILHCYTYCVGDDERVLPGFIVSLLTALTKSAAIRENSSSTGKQKADNSGCYGNRGHSDHSVHSSTGQVYTHTVHHLGYYINTSCSNAHNVHISTNSTAGSAVA